MFILKITDESFDWNGSHWIVTWSVCLAAMWSYIKFLSKNPFRRQWRVSKMVKWLPFNHYCLALSCGHCLNTKIRRNELISISSQNVNKPKWELWTWIVENIWTMEVDFLVILYSYKTNKEIPSIKWPPISGWVISIIFNLK